MPRVSPALLFLALGLYVLPAVVLPEEIEPGAIQLPEVTGRHAVGTAVWHWIKRAEGDDAAALEVVAQLWYPGKTSNAASTRYRPLGGDAFERVRQNAIGAAPFAELPAAAPVIVLCPGRGTNRYYYTTLAEDLASRGFAVFGVDIPYIGYAEFPDGRVVEPSDIYRPSFELITGPYEKVDKFFEPAVTTGLAHLRFALDHLAELNDYDPAGTLTKRLRMDSMGAFGHSLGGRICGALVGNDKRVTAYASMEGVPPRAIRQNGMAAASLMLYSSELPEEMALPNIRELYDNRTEEATILRLEGFGHNSVTDRPLIFPDSFNYAVDATRGLKVVRHVLAQFFEAHLKDGAFSPDELAVDPEISIIETSINALQSIR